MAMVPRKVEADVALRPISGEKFVAADMTAGWRAVGEGAQRLGQTLGQVAEDQDRLDAQLDNAGAKTLDTEAMARINKIRTDFLSNRGLNAGVARPGAEKALGEAQAELLAKATTPRMKRMLGDILTQRVNSTLNDVAEHVRTQTAAAEDDASVARYGALAETAISSPNEDERLKNLAAGLAEIAGLGARRGWDSATVASEQAKYKSGIRTSVIRNMLDSDNVDGAVSYLDTHKDEILDADESRIRSALRDPLERRETDGDVDAVMGGASRGGGAGFTATDPLRGAGRTPVAGGTYGAGRDYGKHKGVDIPAANGTAVYPMGEGVAKVSKSALGGNIVTVDYGNGLVTRYMHLGAVRVKDGDRVTADTIVGTVGMTGRSSGPHLHLETLRNGAPVDPNSVMGKPQGGPEQGARRWNLAETLAAVDRKADEQGWTPERRMRAKEEVQRRVGVDEGLQRRAEDEAQRQALDAISGMNNGQGFTNINQLPADVRSRLSPGDRLRFMDMAASNVKLQTSGDRIKADGDTSVTLNLMAIQDRDTFKNMDLRLYRDKVTPGEFASLATLQAKMRTGQDSPDEVTHSQIWSTIDRYAPDLGLDLGASQGKPRKPDDRAEASRIFNMMRSDLNATTGGNRKPTDDEVKAAFDRAVMTVKVASPGFLWGTNVKEVRRSQLGPLAAGERVQIDIPNDVRARIISSYQRTHGGVNPPDGYIGQTYIRFKGQQGFWQ